MIEEIPEDLPENNILYELLIYAEWQQEPEIQSKGAFEKCDDKSDSGKCSGNRWWWLGPLSPEPCPPYLVQQLKNLQMPWTFSIGGNGAVVAILQDSSLEIRSSRDEYGAVIGRTLVSKDLCPQWRKILWSPDCSMLALAQSNGTIDFYDLIGAHMFTIDSRNSSSEWTQLDSAIAGLAFSDTRVKNTQWSYELLVANYKGIITGYFISPSGGYDESHIFSLSGYYPNGITCFTYHPSSNILLISGKSPKLLSSTKDSSTMGISAWRLISGYPFYKLTLSMGEHMSIHDTNWWHLLFYYQKYKSSTQDLVYKTSISPDGNLLAAIHISGALSLWNLPSLSLKKYWPLSLQPNFDDVHPQYRTPGLKKKADPVISDPYYSRIVDVNWWSNEAVILVRRCGAVTVSSITSLRNLLGISPEWFEPSPEVSAFCGRGFLTIEGETRIQSKKRAPEDLKSLEEESSDEEDPSVFAYTAGLAQRALYFITDNEKFQPPRKKVKLIVKTYRLLCLKSTTPEELYTRKINHEEYGEALAIAKTYNLDCDLVYQRQWRKMPATVESIHDYLSKITKRSWVLHECMERVPENFESTKELLLFGLRGTDLEALIAIGKGEDRGRFVLCSPVEDECDVEDGFVTHSFFEEEALEEKRKAQRLKKTTELLKHVDFKKLTLEQKQLCQCRLKLLTYLDKLTTYEIILGGTLDAEDHYDHTFFKEFRSQCGLESALHFACDSNWQAVATLFTFEGNETLSHRLAILNSFPETTSPLEYQTLLPFFREKYSAFCPWDEHEVRETDWCEVNYQSMVSKHIDIDFVEEFYEKSPDLTKYRHESLESSVVTKWFIERAEEIEMKCGLVQNALELIKLGIERNIKGLEKLYDDLLTLEVLVYDCVIENELNIKKFQEMEDFEKIKLIMSNTTEENFMRNLKQWLLPFLSRCEKHVAGSAKSLFKSYILWVSKDDLTFCQKILENHKPDLNPTLSDEEMATLSLDSAYFCEREDQIKISSAIMNLTAALLQQSCRSTGPMSQALLEKVEQLRKHIRAAELLKKNGTSVTLAVIKNISNNPEDIKKALIKLTRLASRKSPNIDETEWKGLLSDILEMQHKLFSCISQEECYEIVLHSLLCSGKQEGITLAGKMMECNTKPQRKRTSLSSPQFKLPYKQSVNLVVVASREYFNSSASSSDPCMTLARSCLNLIEDVPIEIEEELDLITSLTLLQEFNVSILPLQVRLCEDKISIIQQALQKTKKAYKKSLKIMQLANLLRAWSCNQNDREGKVLTLIGEQAFQVKDYDACFSAISQLIERGYEDGWQICYQLAECDEFNDIQARSNLMSFALAYCSDDLIDTILESQSKLQLQILHERVKFLMGDDFVPFEVGENSSENEMAENASAAEGVTALWETGNKTLQALQNTTQTTKQVLTSVGSKQFWKDAVKYLSQPTLFFSLLYCTVENLLITSNNCWIQPLALSWNKESGNMLQESNNNVSKQGICAFYSGLVENAHISNLEANYQRFARPDPSQPEEIAMSILQASIIENCLKSESETSNVPDAVLLDLAKAYVTEDMVLSLSFLLSLSEFEEAVILFETLPSSPIVLQLACLYYAIVIIVIGAPSNVISDSGLFQGDPSVIIRKVIDTANSGDALQTDEIRTAFTFLTKYNKMLYDYIQASVLQKIGGGVDTARFTNDDEYKKDTILGIAMTLDDDIFHQSVSLAHHYGLPLWDLYMTHLEYLFSESSTSTAAMNERIQKLKILSKLREKPDLFQERLINVVYPTIDGKDHERLIFFYTILENFRDNADGLLLKPSVHKKLLNKFKCSTNNFDYKSLMRPESSSSSLLPLIKESNVHVFAKSASKIPKRNGTFFEPGNIYCMWVKKFFFDGSSVNAKVPNTKSEWLHRYEACNDMIQKLSPSDVLEFIDHTMFTKRALEKLSIDCRAEIVKRSLKFCKQKFSKVKEDFETSSQWRSTISTLTLYYQHLQRMEDEILVQLKESYDPKVIAYCEEFDLSKSVAEKLHDLLVKVVVEGPDLELLKTLLSVCPADLEWEPSDAYIEAINRMLNQMKQPQSSHGTNFKTSNIIATLETVLEDVSKNREELMEDVVVELLNDFCQDVTVSVSTRLSILQLLEKSNCLSEEHRELLLLYRTQAVVSSMWTELDVSEEEVKDPHCRRNLFDNLISLSRTVQHFSSLSKLLTLWPPLPFSEEQVCEDEPWTKLLCGLIDLQQEDGLDLSVNILKNALASATFNLQCCQDVYKRIENQGSILHSLKFALTTSYESLHEEAIQLLKNTSVQIHHRNYDDELLELILRQHMTPRVTPTFLYKPVIEFLLQCQEDITSEDDHRSIDCVAQQLALAGQDAEAGSLLLLKSSMHPGLSTFSSAFHFLKRFLN